MTDIKSMTIDELKKLMTTLGDKPFRAKQIYSWLHEHLVTSYDEMTNLSKSLREKLKEYPVTALKMVDVQTSRIDGTQKYLFRLSDGNVIESVLMRYKHGNSVCISSQVGCRMGCRFCASHRRTDQMSSPVRNAGSDIQDTGSDRRKSFQCCGHGNGGTS